MTALTSALNSRKSGAPAAVVAVQTDSSTSSPAVKLRPLRTGEVGARVRPPADYSKDALLALLARLSTGCGFVYEHLDDKQGASQLGLLVELAEDAAAMLRLHMANGILHD